MSHISILYLIPFVLYWYIGYFAHSHFKDVSIIMSDGTLSFATNATVFISFYLGCLGFYHALAAAYYKVRTLNQVEIRMLVMLYFLQWFHNWSNFIVERREQQRQSEVEGTTSPAGIATTSV